MQLLQGKIEPLSQYKGQKGNFVKTFLINDELNKNLWLANNRSHLKNLDRWIGAPGLEYFNEQGKRDHPPESDTVAEAKEKQKPYIRAEIVDIGHDGITGNFWEISIVHDEKLYQNIVNGTVQFVSPSIMRTQGSEVGPVRIADDYIPIHYAFVDEPAYGGQAKVVGTCSRCTVAEAKEKLDPLIASIRERQLQNDSFKLNHMLKSNKIDNETLEKQLKAAEEQNTEMKKTVDSLKADIDELKKSVKQESANDDADKKKTENANDDDKKQENANEETDEEKKQKQESAAVVEEFKLEKINTILQASKAHGVDEKTLEEHRRMLQASSLDQIKMFEKMIVPAGKIFSIQESASTKFPNFDGVDPDIMDQFSASTEGSDSTSKLQALGVMSR